VDRWLDEHGLLDDDGNPAAQDANAERRIEVSGKRTDLAVTRSVFAAEAAWLGRPAFRWAVEAWAVAEAKATLVDRWLDEHGLQRLGRRVPPCHVVVHASCGGVQCALAPGLRATGLSVIEPP